MPISHFVTALYQDRAERLWVGNLGFLCRIQGRHCAPVDLSVPSTFLSNVSAMHEDRQGRFFLGGDSGLTVGLPALAGTNGRSWSAYPLDHSVRAIVETKGGDILLGSMGSGLGRYLQDGQVE